MSTLVKIDFYKPWLEERKKKQRTIEGNCVMKEPREGGDGRAQVELLLVQQTDRMKQAGYSILYRWY